jgi:membrane-associated protein
VTPLLQAFSLTPLLLPSWFDPENIIQWLGPYALWGVAFIIFAECGLFAILPGDSLLFTVGIFTAINVIDHSMFFVCTVLTIAAVLGNVVGYGLGRLIGPPLFRERTGFMGQIFKPSYVEKTRVFLDRYGSRALILARFVPIVRTFVTLVAGVSRMNFRHFIAYTAIGGVLWAVGVTTLGFYLGNVPFIKNNIDAVLILIVAVSLIPMAVEFLLARRRQRTAGTPVG